MTLQNQKTVICNAAKLLILIVGVAAVTACSGEGDKPKAGPKAKPATAAADAATTAAATAAPGEQTADNQVEFYAERYLRPEERLKRRQDRIKAALAD